MLCQRCKTSAVDEFSKDSGLYICLKCGHIFKDVSNIIDELSKSTGFDFNDMFKNT